MEENMNCVAEEEKQVNKQRILGRKGRNGGT